MKLFTLIFFVGVALAGCVQRPINPDAELLRANRQTQESLGDIQQARKGMGKVDYKASRALEYFQ